MSTYLILWDDNEMGLNTCNNRTGLVVVGVGVEECLLSLL